MKKILSYILPERIIRFIQDYINGYYKLSYSQEGEDMILNRLFGECKPGFYVDVGAHHPKKYSNTFFFYKRGWRGINIDAMPGSMKLFNILRTRDINIEQPIASEKKLLTYYMFNESALNGFSKDLSEQRSASNKRSYIVKEKIDMQTCTLENILDKNLPKDCQIDFLSIDVEGLDFDVLKSNNFEKYNPRIILVEMLDANYNDVISSNISNYLKVYNYQPIAKSVNTIFFITSDFYKERFGVL